MPDVKIDLRMPQLDALLTKMEAFEKELTEIIKWVRPDSFAVTEPPAQAPAPTPPAQPSPSVPSAPNAPAPQSVPTTAPTYTTAQIATAGADLLASNPQKMTELLGILTQFGVQAITDLTPDQLGPFATALRGIGGRI